MIELANASYDFVFFVLFAIFSDPEPNSNPLSGFGIQIILVWRSNRTYTLLWIGFPMQIMLPHSVPTTVNAIPDSTWSEIPLIIKTELSPASVT